MPETDATIAEVKNSRIISELKVQRGTIKGQQTRLKNQMNKFSDMSKAELETRLGLLEGYLQNFNLVQTKLDCLDEEEARGNERENFEETYCAIKSKILTSLSSKQVRASITFPGDTSIMQKNINLPKIALSKFSGKYSEWPDFYSMFRTLVHDDELLTNIEKFQHLRSCLTDKALFTIQALEMTSDNYEIALKLLKNRFDNKRLIFQAHIDEIFKLPKVENNSVNQLRSLSDAAGVHMRALLSLASKEQIADALLIHIITHKFDVTTQLKWEDEAPLEVMPTWDEFLAFIQKRCQTMENVAQIQENSNSTTKPASTLSKRHTNHFRKTSLITANNTKACALCKDTNHIINSCSKFISISPIDRFKEIKRLNLCINCLRPGHNVKACKAGRCHYCHFKHHSLLHMSSIDEAKNEISANASVPANLIAIDSQPKHFESPFSSSLSNCHKNSNLQNIQVFLATAIIYIQDATGSFVPCRALLDSASQLNFVTERIRQQLNIRRIKTDIPISGIGSSSMSVKYKTSITIKSRFNDYSINLDAFVLQSITTNQPEKFVDITDWNIPPNINLSDPAFNTPQTVDMLIGAGLFFDLLCVGQIKLGENLPILQKTLLGWIVSGPCKSNSSRSISHIAVTNSNEFDIDSSLDTILQRFWEMENQISSHKRSLSMEEAICEKHFLENYSRSESGRYSVRLPFNENPALLGDSLEIAKKRLFRLEQKLSKHPELKSQYNDFIEEYINLNHMTAIDYETLSKCNHYFLPHHAVMKPDSSTTKLRVVFDGSCKTSTGRSLNDILMVGPVVQDELFTILLRFRTYRYAITADITKMYRQVLVKDPDNYLQCILWRNSTKEPLQIYRLLTVTYGTAPASFLATRCLTQLALDETLNFPLGAKVLRKDFYVDDMITGAHSLEVALQIRNEVDNLLKRGGFILHKWCSNNEGLMRTLPDNDKEKLIQICGSHAIKTLGLIWDPHHDEFCYKFNAESKSNVSTKRIVLSKIASLFDPLGLVNPIVVKAKIFMQQLWKLKLKWDESLPLELHTKWIEFYKQLQLINNIKVPRHLIDHYEYLELHGFADASSAAYGACVYLRSFNTCQNISCKLFCAKSRVAPVKSISIPRLELSAALLLAELIHRIHSSIEINVSNVFCWSDSTIVLSWISSEPCKFTTFVANRITKIQELTSTYHWRHIPTQDNPADSISRGLYPLELLKSENWFNGPGFLLKPQADWPHSTSSLNTDDLPEKRKEKSALISVNTSDIISSSKFCNSFLRLQRVFGYLYRFYYNTRNKNNKIFGTLVKSEIAAGLSWIIRIVQGTYFAEEFSKLSKGRALSKNSKLKRLNPFLGPDGIIRVGGRIQNSGLEYDSIHPILLPKEHKFTKALMTHYHNKHMHANPQTLLAIVRTKFWPIGGKYIAKQVQHNCIRCFRVRPKTIEQLMGILPPERVNPSRPFLHSGIDFFGPFYITSQIRGRAPTKVYGCIFICFATKAVHIELVSNLTTEAFLGALKRFIARRGRVAKIFSDNATNFVGACKELEELRKLFQTEQHKKCIQNYCEENGLSWKFAPPRSPHFGGLWESAVKAAKYHIRRVIGQHLLTYEELNTLLCQVEAAINSRPITPLSTHPDDISHLTPGHFLIGSPLLSLPEPDTTDININYLTRWQRVKAMHQRFWKIWSRDYLQSLQHRSKWTHSYPNIPVNTLVLVMDDNLPPLKWNLGRIVDVHPGADGSTRVVSIKTPNGIVKRAITKICPLPLENNETKLVSEEPKAGGML